MQRKDVVPRLDGHTLNLARLHPQQNQLSELYSLDLIRVKTY